MIRQGKRNTHRTFMLSSLILSVVFLLSYLIYHSKAHHVEFQGEGAIKFVYLFILLSHILLSVAVVPLALISVYRGLASKFAAHRKIARWTFPIWLYVSVTGVLVYYFAHVYNVA